MTRGLWNLVWAVVREGRLGRGCFSLGVSLGHRLLLRLCQAAAFCGHGRDCVCVMRNFEPIRGQWGACCLEGLGAGGATQVSVDEEELGGQQVSGQSRPGDLRQQRERWAR